MFRTLRAFTWMRWRIARNSFKSKNRDSFEQISRALATLAPFFMVLLLVPSVLVLAGLALFIGVKMGQHGSVMIQKSYLFVGLRVALAIATVIVLIAPMVRSSRGTGSETTRMLLLPIHRRTLHAAEVVGALSDPWLAVAFPALLLFPLGLLIGNALLGGIVALIAALLFISVLMLAVSIASFAIALIFRKRRRAEWFTVVVITVLAFSGVGFVLLSDGLENNAGGKLNARHVEDDAQASAVTASEHLDASLPAVIQFLPSELYTRAIADGVSGQGVQAAYRLALLAAWAALFYFTSLWAYSRLLETPESGHSGRGGGFRANVRELPWVGAGTSAVALAMMRLTLRSVRGKTGVYLNFAVVSMVYLVLVRQNGEMTPPGGTSFGMAIGVLGTIFTLLSLQPVLANVFAVDGPGLTMQALSPLSTREILRGKWVGGALLTATSSTLCFAAGLLLDPTGSPWIWLAALLLAISAYVAFAPLAMLVSMLLPKVANLSRLGKDGNAQPIAALIATVAVPLVLLPPLLGTAFALLILKSALATVLVAALWLGLVSLLSVFALRRLGNLFERRLETLLLVAGGR